MMEGEGKNEPVSCNREWISTSIRAILEILPIHCTMYLLVVIGIQFSLLIRPAHLDVSDEIIARWRTLDGRHYQSIALAGYSKGGELQALPAFFPGYPVVSRLVSDLGVPIDAAMIAVTWCSLLVALLVSREYIKRREPNDSVVQMCVVYCFAINPLGFHLRLMYSESLFVCLLIGALLAIETKARPFVVAAIVGALTGTRPVGVCMVPIVVAYAWSYENARFRRFATSMVCTLIACWGVSVYMLHLWLTIGDPLAFYSAQDHWVTTRHSFSEKLVSLATGDPIWRVYNDGSSSYWDRFHTGGAWYLSNQTGDIASWILCLVAICYGMYRRWLNGYEAWTAILLFAFVTWFQADRNDMRCQGRFVSVIFPAYLVAGKCVAAMRIEIRFAIAMLASAMYVIYVAQFAAGYAW